mgnify:CR=1 FL=1
MTEQLPLSLPKDRKEIDALQRRQKPADVPIQQARTGQLFPLLEPGLGSIRRAVVHEDHLGRRQLLLAQGAQTVLEVLETVPANEDGGDSGA